MATGVRDGTAAALEDPCDRLRPFDTKGGMLDGIERDVEPRGDLSAEQRAQLLEIANKCPVHKTLTSEINIRTRLV
jgi:putative redox protein